MWEVHIIIILTLASWVYLMRQKYVCLFLLLAIDGAGDESFPHTTLKWRHNAHDGVSNHRRLDCILNCLFKGRSKKTSKLRVTGLCEGNSPVAGEFPHKGPVTQRMFPFDDVIMRQRTVYPAMANTIFANDLVTQWAMTSAGTVWTYFHFQPQSV